MFSLNWPLFNKLEKEYGDSFYILNLEAFRQNYNGFLEAFREIYPKTNIAYSYKTNYIPKLCQCVNSSGGYAEVVSDMEYNLAVKLGVSPKDIIFNGPYKTKENIKKAVLQGATVNLDSSYEVSILGEINEEVKDIKGRIGLRCNFDIGEAKISRFGFNIEENEFQSAFKLINGLKNFRVSGFHCHYSTVDRSIESFSLRTKKMIEIALECFKDEYPEFIDIGGGFFSKMPLDLKKQFKSYVPDYKEYAIAIAKQFVDSFKGEKTPELIVEPGTALTADVMKFICKVIDVKKIRSRKIALVSGNLYNIKPTLNNKNLPVTVISKEINVDKEEGPFDIVGNTCREDDCLFSNFKGTLKKGDFLVFENVGAYTIVLKPPFIHPSPFILSYEPKTDDFVVVKRRETIAEIFSTYEF